MKEFVGEVVSTKSEKTALVRIDWVAVHPVYKKRVRKSQKIKAHDIVGVKMGQRVKIVETRPISKDKHFLIKEVLN